MKPPRLLAVYVALAYVFLHVPLLILAVFSFNSSRFTTWQGFSFTWYQTLIRDRDLMEAAGNSMIIALATTLIATVLGTMVAYALWKRDVAWLSRSLYLSLLTPEIVTGVSMLALFQWAFRYLDLRLGMQTVILAHVGFSLAYVVVVVLARLRGFDRVQEEAAMDLGATEFQAFLRVTLPYLIPAVVAAAMLVFTISIDDYVITSLVAGVDSQTLPMVIYALARRGVSPELNAVSTVLIFSLGTLVLLSERLRAR